MGREKIIRQIVSRLLKDGEISADYAPFLKSNLLGVDESLTKYIMDGATAERISNFAGMSKTSYKVAKPEFNVDKYYKPAVRIDESDIIHGKGGYHGEVLGEGLVKRNINPADFDLERVHGTGGIGPDGHYYESSYIGDVHDIPDYIYKMFDKKMKRGAISIFC